jgi:hypothetical protein
MGNPKGPYSMGEAMKSSSQIDSKTIPLISKAKTLTSSHLEVGEGDVQDWHLALLQSNMLLPTSYIGLTGSCLVIMYVGKTWT